MLTLSLTSSLMCDAPLLLPIFGGITWKAQTLLGDFILRILLPCGKSLLDPINPPSHRDAMDIWVVFSYTYSYMLYTGMQSS